MGGGGGGGEGHPECWHGNEASLPGTTGGMTERCGVLQVSTGGPQLAHIGACDCHMTGGLHRHGYAEGLLGGDSEGKPLAQCCHGN